MVLQCQGQRLPRINQEEFESRECLTKGAHHHLSYHLMVCKVAL